MEKRTMRRVTGSNVKVKVDETGGMVSVDWECPYCGEFNAGFYFSSNAEAMSGDFEVDECCDDCGKMCTIECCDAELLF